MSKKRPKSHLLKIIEYTVFYSVIRFFIALPPKLAHVVCTLFGDFLYIVLIRRRRIALDNLFHAFRGEKDNGEIRGLARTSFISFVVLLVDTFKLQFNFSNPHLMDFVRAQTENLDKFMAKAKKIHDESGGCIFVTPHIGIWEALPFLSSSAGIPITVVIRPLDNEYLEKKLYASRIASGQAIIPKSNAILKLKQSLKKGHSIGLLPDQGAVKGIPIPYFGRMARTTPMPALLAIQFHRPLVVVAGCRKHDGPGYEGFICDPIWPRKSTNEKEEVFRLTQAVNEKMEIIIRKYPDQYFWFHDRWHDYGDVREYFT